MYIRGMIDNNEMLLDKIDALNVDPEQITGGLPRSSAPIRIGDIVISTN